MIGRADLPSNEMHILLGDAVALPWRLEAYFDENEGAIKYCSGDRLGFNTLHFFQQTSKIASQVVRLQ